MIAVYDTAYCSGRPYILKAKVRCIIISAISDAQDKSILGMFETLGRSFDDILFDDFLIEQMGQLYFYHEYQL